MIKVKLLLILSLMILTGHTATAQSDIEITDSTSTEWEGGIDIDIPVETHKYSVTAVSADESKGSVSIDGGGSQVVSGTQVTVTATPAEGYGFTAWTADGNVVSTDNPYTFAAARNIALTANFKKLVTNSYDMAKGWNWVSTNIATEAISYIHSIEDKVDRLVSQTDEMVNDPNYGFVGTLKTLDVISGYKLLTTEETTLKQYGLTTTPAEMSIQLYNGWNWIGYLPTQVLSVSTALDNLQVANGERLVSQNSFAIYGDNGWEGNLTVMNPGEGYMYFRTTEATAFYYPDKVTESQSVPLYLNKSALQDNNSNVPWDYDIHRYRDVTTIVARLYAIDMPLNLAGYSVGAFCGEECRGVAQQVGDKLFITVHGTVTDNENIVFRAYEHVTGDILSISETITFQGQMLGDLINPMELHVQSSTTGIFGISTLPVSRAIYSPDGKRLNHLQQGVNIIVNADGTTQKVIVK